MEEIDPVFLVVAAGGLMLLVIRLVPLIITDINGPAFDAQIQKLLKADNRDRAIKLCSAAPNAAYVVVVKALLEESKARSARDGEGLIRESLKEAYERAVVNQQKRLRKLSSLAPIGVIIAAGATFLALTGEKSPPPQVFLPPVIAAVLWFTCLRKLQRFDRYFEKGGEWLVPLATTYVLEHPNDR